MNLYEQAVAAERAAKIARDMMDHEAKIERDRLDHAAGIESMRQQLAAVERQRDDLKAEAHRYDVRDQGVEHEIDDKQ